MLRLLAFGGFPLARLTVLGFLLACLLLGSDRQCQYEDDDDSDHDACYDRTGLHICTVPIK